MISCNFSAVCLAHVNKFTPVIITSNALDQRRKGEHAIKDIIGLSRRGHDDLACSIVQSIAKACARDSIAMKRLGGLQLKQRHMLGCVILKYPHLPGVDVRKFITSFLDNNVPRVLHADRCVAVRVKDIKFPSIASVMSNVHRWAKSVDQPAFPRTCRFLRKHLSIQSSCSFSRHVCIKACETMFSSSAPSHVNVQTAAVWNKTNARRVIGRVRHKINQDLKASLRYKLDFSDVHSFLDTVYRDFVGFRGLGVLQDDLLGWKSLLDNHCVISIVDKLKSELVMSCPLGYQTKCVAMVSADESLYFDVPSNQEIQDVLTEASHRLAYCGARIYTQHVFGQWIGIPKASCLETKLRSLGSYAKHSLRGVFTVFCGALNILLAAVCGVQVCTTNFWTDCEEFLQLEC